LHFLRPLQHTFHLFSVQATLAHGKEKEMAKPFETIIAEERERLAKDREIACAERQAAQDKLDAVDRELAAIDAYEQVKAGKFQRPQARKPRAASGGRAPRGELSVRQRDILGVVEKYMPDGVKTETIMEELEARSEEVKRPIYAAIDKLKKGGIVQQAGKRQPYTLGPNAPQQTEQA
jgi:hypothetical protein